MFSFIYCCYLRLTADVTASTQIGRIALDIPEESETVAYVNSNRTAVLNAVAAVYNLNVSRALPRLSRLLTVSSPHK